MIKADKKTRPQDTLSPSVLSAESLFVPLDFLDSPSKSGHFGHIIFVPMTPAKSPTPEWKACP